MSPLAQTSSEDRNGVRLVRVSGEIDLSNAHEVLDAITSAVPDGASPLVVDLSATEYLDSAGIAMLFRLAQRMRYGRQELRLVVPHDTPIRTVVRLTNLEKVVPVDETFGLASHASNRGPRPSGGTTEP